MTKVKELIFHNTKLTMLILSVVSLISVILYMWAVNLTVRNVVKREALETEMSALTNKISELEFVYIRKKNSITLEYAATLGFVPASETKFVSRKSSVAIADISSSDF